MSDKNAIAEECAALIQLAAGHGGPLSDAELTRRVQEENFRCPSCNFDEMEFGEHSNQAGPSYRLRATCKKCGGTWLEFYDFKLAKDFTPGGKK